MARFKSYVPSGVIPACLLPFNSDFSIDEAGLRKHLADVGAVDGITAVTVNAHASEVASCTFDEQIRVMEITGEALGDRLPIVCGIYADGSFEAARLARMAERTGASALLVFPSQTLGMGGALRPEMALAHFKCIADATDLPIIVFQYPAASNVQYPVETLLKLFEQVPAIKAIKDWCNDAMLHERHVTTFQALPRPVTVLSTHSAWLMSSLVMGCNGLLSGAGSVIADLQVALFRAVQADDLKLAKRINKRMLPMVQAFYAPPFLDMHNRMKEALVLLGRLDQAVVRPPLMKLDAAEIARLKAAIKAAGIARDGAFASAA
ncbi:MAG: dihydrodipicolinate synthase family protein [Proteobacteria bacterium]|nr:dihydrodipicolinate synthase family protein [Pseudomonadota bacterium]